MKTNPMLVIWLMSIILMSACGTNTTYYTGPSVNVADVIQVSLHLNSQGEFVVGGQVSVPLANAANLGSVSWDFGFETVLNQATEKSNYLIILWQDEDGDIREDDYSIGQPFKITFEHDQWVQRIEHTQQGNIILSVQKQAIPTVTAMVAQQPAEVVPPKQTPQVSIIGGDDVFAYFDSAKALGELAEEQYSLAERNKVNRTLNFTINLNSSRPVIWRWYWCATKKNILNQNMQAINVEFILNGENISNQFNSRYFPFTEDPMKGWTCFTYEAVLTDWDSGTYYLEQNTTIAQPINDGEADFSDGYKIYEYTIYVQ